MRLPWGPAVVRAIDHFDRASGRAIAAPEVEAAHEVQGVVHGGKFPGGKIIGVTARARVEDKYSARFRAVAAPELGKPGAGICRKKQRPAMHQPVAHLREVVAADAMARAGVDVFHQHGAGLGAIGCPKLVAMRAVVRKEQDLVAQHAEPDRGAARAAGLYVLDYIRAGCRAVAAPKLGAAAAVIGREVHDIAQGHQAALGARKAAGGAWVDVFDYGGGLSLEEGGEEKEGGEGGKFLHGGDVLVIFF